MGHAGRAADRLRHPVGGARLPVRLRLRPGGQRAAGAAGAGVSGGRPRRLHADRVAAAGDGRDGVAGESAGDVLSRGASRARRSPR